MTLSEELEKRGITRTELAKIMKVSRSTIQRMGEEVSKSVLAVLDEPEYTWLDTPITLFDGHGRGHPVRNPDTGRFEVLIARGGEIEDTAVSIADWKARLSHTCKHGRDGWGCKICLI